MTKQRIAYIDAMLGFTMILVVFSHVCGMCLGDRLMGFNDVFFLFRLPCFFMISGWLFEGTSGILYPRKVIRHKFMVQIVPTFIFLLILAPPPLFFSRLGAVKGGYWFTFALFEFFVIYLFSERYLRKWSGALALVISVLAFCYDIYYNRLQMCIADVQCSMFNVQWITDVLGFLSFMTWRYYLFFFIGTRIKRYFETFLRWTDKWLVMTVVVGGFIAIACLPHQESAIGAYLVFSVGGILGMTMIFTLFRRLSLFTSHSSLLNYIGTRTLDIYLLHYFFLPRFLNVYGESLRNYDNKCFEFFVAMALALIVVCICLLVSYLIRLNPTLGHYLFGVKKIRTV